MSDSDRFVRETFIATKRHDLRTPINAILGYSEMLLEDARDEGNDSRAVDLEKIHAAGRALLHSVNNLLDPEKIESGHVDLSDMAALGARIEHALRNDLTTVIGYGEMLLEEVDRDNEEQVATDLERICTAAEQLGSHVKDLIDFSGVVIGQAELDPQDSAPLMVRGVADTIRDLDEQRAADAEAPGHILVVDDKEPNRDLLSRRLEHEGHRCATAADGRQALEAIAKADFDLILLDILMPVMNGYQVLQYLKSDARLAQIPVIVLSALDKTDNVARCIEIGADDFLAKPFNPVILKARIRACLEKKRFRDREQAYLEEIRIEREKSERLLLNILPAPIAERLKTSSSIIADGFAEATVLFSDFVGFTQFSARITAEELVSRLNELFQAFDSLAEAYGVEKIKTIGDAYMVAGGLPIPQPDHAERIADMALGMLGAVEEYNARAEEPLEIRIGIHTGPVVAGVIGSSKFAYDLWGDTVNTASRMESNSLPGRIHVSEAIHDLLRARYRLESRGIIEVKGKGEMKTYFLEARR
jgi:adenylate cyclase